jgi:hypothetical protein
MQEMNVVDRMGLLTGRAAFVQASMNLCMHMKGVASDQLREDCTPSMAPIIVCPSRSNAQIA